MRRQTIINFNLINMYVELKNKFHAIYVLVFARTRDCIKSSLLKYSATSYQYREQNASVTISKTINIFLRPIKNILPSFSFSGHRYDLDD